MQVTIEPGMSFAGIQGTPDRRVLTLNKQERATLEKARVICEKADDLLRVNDPDFQNEFGYAEMHLAEVLLEKAWDIEALWETVT